MTVLTPVREMFEATPEWVTNGGRSVRAFDRRDGWESWGRGHRLVSPADLVVTNGIIRYQVGTYGDVPFLDVMTKRNGVWRSVGSVYLVEPGTLASAHRLVRARIVENTPDRCRVALTVTGLGDVNVWLLRGERTIRIANGSPSSPSVARWVGWSHGPPADVFLGCSIAPGAFAGALDTGTGQARLLWPSALRTSSWAVSVRWLPDAGSASLGDSGILSIEDSAGAVSTLQYVASTKTIRWTQAATVLSSAALTFSAGDSLCITIGHSSATGRSLSVGAATVTNPAATGPGTSEATYSVLALGGVGGTVAFDSFGDGSFGDGVFGGTSISGGAAANGLYDNLMVFSERLSATEAATLAGAQFALAGLPTPEARLVRYWPFDAPLETNGSAMTSGAAFEATSDGGVTPLIDGNGLFRGLIAAQTAATKSSGLGVGLTGRQLDVGLYVGTVAEGADQINEYFAANRQQTRVRLS